MNQVDYDFSSFVIASDNDDIEVLWKDSNHFRNQHLARDVAISIIKARLYAKNLYLEKDSIRVYTLPDDVTWPNDLKEYEDR